MKWLLTLFLAGACAAETLRVPQDFPTIQSALDSMSDGDTVLVAVNEYAEALVAPPISFVLQGDVTPDTVNYPRPVIDPSSLTGSQYLACLRTSTPDSGRVVVEDFVFRNGAGMYPRTINDVGGIVNNSLDMTIRRCVFDSTWIAIAPCPGRTSVEDCNFVDIQGYGIRNINATSRFHATDCSFTGKGSYFVYCRDSTELVRCTFSDTAAGSRGSLLKGWGTTHGVTIRDCIFGPVTQAMYRPVELWGVSGLIEGNTFRDFQAGYGALSLRVTDTDTVTIRGNVFENITAPPGIWSVACLTITPDIGGPFAAVIEDNTMLNCTGTDTSGKAVILYVGARISGNHFANVEPPGGWTILQHGNRPGIELEWNRFDHTGRAYQVEPLPPEAVDGRFNWWGDSTGPYHPTQNPHGLGDRVGSGVTFWPWLLDTLESAGPGPRGFEPADFVLNVYPNPFNQTVRLTLAPAGMRIVTLEVYDLLGRKAATVWQGPLAYRREVTFDAAALPSGIYFARVTDVLSRRPLAAKKLILLK